MVGEEQRSAPLKGAGAPCANGNTAKGVRQINDERSKSAANPRSCANSEKSERPDPTILAIAFTLLEAATQNKLLTGPEVVLTRFHTLTPPKISILNYILYLKNKTGCNKSCFVTAMILIDRLLSKNSYVKVMPNTVHKLFLCSILTAAKFTTDRTIPNSVWANLGGVKLEELNLLETEFLFLLGFSLVVTKDEYELYDQEISKKAKLPAFSGKKC